MHTALCRTPPDSASNAADTLVIYVFRFTDPEALNNLVYFIEHGIKASF